MRSFRSRLSLLLPFVAAVACKTTSSTSGLSEAEVREYQDELGMKPGVGFESILGDVRGECLTYDGLEQLGNSQEAVYSVKLVESFRDLTGQLGVSSATQVKYATTDGSNDASRLTKFALGTTFSVNRYSVFVVVSARIRNETKTLKNPKVKDNIRTQLEANPAQNIQAFRDQCGDAYMTGFSTGGEFHAVIEIKAESDAVLASLKGQYGTQVGAQANQNNGNVSMMESGLSGIAANRQVRIWTYQRGGSGEAEVGLVSTVPELMQRLRTLADSVRNNTNPRPITATFNDYLTLGFSLPVEYREKIQAAKEVISTMAAAQAALLDLQGDLDFILTQPNGFIGVDGAKLAQIAQTKREIEARLKRIHDAGKACATNYATCRAANDIGVPAFDLPRRKPTLDALSSERVRIKSTLHYVNRDALYDGWWNPPECYVVINAGKGDNDKIPVRRTETTYGPNNERCNNLGFELTVPVAILKDTWSNLGAGPQNGWIEVEFWEDDPSYDDFIGSTWVHFRDLQNGAALKGINNSNVNADIGFEIEY